MQNATKRQESRQATTLAERVSASLQKLRRRDRTQKSMFSVPDHWMRQTGKLSKGERRKLETYGGPLYLHHCNSNFNVNFITNCTLTSY